MKNFNKAVSIIVEDIKRDLNGYYKAWDIQTWSELLDAYGIDTSEMKDNIRYTLITATNNGDIECFFTDDLEIINEDGSTKTYRQLTNAVRRRLFEM